MEIIFVYNNYLDCQYNKNNLSVDKISKMVSLLFEGPFNF